MEIDVELTVFSLVISFSLGILVVYLRRKVFEHTSIIINILILFLSIVLPILAILLLIYYTPKLFIGKKDIRENQPETIEKEISEMNDDNEIK